MLAKKAAKKGVIKTKNEILEHVKKAEKIESGNVSEVMEKCLKAIENEIEEWHLNGVEDFEIQRFVARILKKLKDLNVLVSVDHATFKKELNFIHPLEMNISEDNGVTLSRDQVIERSEKLLESVIDPAVRHKLDRTMHGAAWRIANDEEQEAVIRKGKIWIH